MRCRQRPLAGAETEDRNKETVAKKRRHEVKTEDRQSEQKEWESNGN